MDFDSLGERLKKLKQKRVAVTLKNRKEIARDAATPSAGKPKTYSMNEDEGAVRVGEESDSSKSASSNVLHYNILECEKWNQKEKLRSEVLDTAHSADLAHLTYKKEVQRLQKKGLPKGRVTKGEITASGKVKVKDDGQLVERLADTLKETAQQRYVHRRNELSKDGNDGSSTLDKFINEKNKKFNARLEKQFRRTDT